MSDELDVPALADPYAPVFPDPPPVPKRKAGRPKNITPVVQATGAKAKPKTVAEPPKDLHAYSTDGDLVDIWERRMLNPHQRPSLPIRLTTPGMHIRWINLANNGRYQRARYEEGWVPCHKDELKDAREIYGVSYTTEGWVCRGEKQQEMLMKIPEAVWKKIRQAKYNEVEKSRKNLKDRMLQSASQHFSDKLGSGRGDAVADRLSTFKGDIKFGAENVSPVDEGFSGDRGGDDPGLDPAQFGD